MASFFLVILYLFMQMSFMWGLYRILKNPSVVDVSWSLGLMISGLLYLGSAPLNSRTLVIGSLLILWALRLAFYLWFTRIRKGEVDKRYTELSSGWKISPSLGFFINFQFQGILILVISSVFFLISRAALSHFILLDYIAFALCIAGIVGETIADWQLQNFKATYKGEVCNVGLWGYSRHPNYFFDWCCWLGFALFALSSKWGYLSLLSPFVLYIIFTRITGPMTESGSLKSRGQKYHQYQKRTSMFFPWFKKKSDFE